MRFYRKQLILQKISYKRLVFEKEISLLREKIKNNRNIIYFLNETFSDYFVLQTGRIWEGRKNGSTVFCVRK